MARSPRSTPNDNREMGKSFEEIFKKRAQSNGLLPFKQGLSAKYVYGGRVQVEKSDLDFKLISRGGTVAYVDSKAFSEERFPYSALTEHQRDIAALYNDWSVPAGFVIWFFKFDKVVFYSGYTIKKKGPGTSFGFEDGLELGSTQEFDLRPILSAWRGFKGSVRDDE